MSFGECEGSFRNINDVEPEVELETWNRQSGTSLLDNSLPSISGEKVDIDKDEMF
jgi:hypothetical protein